MTARRIGIALITAIAATVMLAQVYRPIIENPPAGGGLNAPPEVAALLRGSCYDCHSNETHWPMYARIAPLSWFVAHDVNRGRQELNFSEWNTYFPQTRHRKLQWIARSLTQEDMPPRIYELMHPSSRLSPADRKTIINWIETRFADQGATIRSTD